MIAMAIGIFLLGAAGSFFLSNMKSSRDLLLYSQVQQELRQSADLMQRELRRAGYSLLNQSAVKTAYLKRNQSSTGSSNYDCVLYSYYNADDSQKNDLGFMLDDNGSIQFKAQGVTTSTNNNKTCNTASTYGTWQPLTSGPSSTTATDGIAKITGFDISFLPPWTTGSAQLAAVASSNLITRTTGSFVTDGFQVGDLVTLAGFSSSNNFVQAKVTAVNVTSLQLATVNSSGTATQLADDTAAANRTVSRQGNALSITLVGQSTKDSKIKASYNQIITLFNVQALDSAL